MKIFATALFVLLLSAPALAQESASASLSTEGLEAEGGGNGGTVEIGVYGGVFLPASKHELYEPDNTLLDFGHHPLKKVAPDFGLRFGLLPLDVLGLEIEAGIMPTKTRDTDESVIIYTARANVMLMPPTEVIVPFLLVGGGVLGESSDSGVLGSDNDASLHVGIGAKAYLSDDFLVRLDLRDNFTRAYLDQKVAMHWEALLGLSVVLGRSEPNKPVDTDGDGIVDGIDQCITVPGPAPDGCPPPPPPDSDGDGITDPQDACPNAAGPASDDPKTNGCPPPPDGDGDGVPDDRDACPTEAGDGPDGCPLDSDGDGILDRDDKCPREAETRNGHEDQDGCPDELPQAVKEFMGVIEGITFQVNKATIRKPSYPTLDKTVSILKEYPDLKLEISGHTDSTGSAERNDELSKERAEAVKTYLVDKGIDNLRLEAIGVGSARPIADNATKKGRDQNRRIEFKVVVQ